MPVVPEPELPTVVVVDDAPEVRTLVRTTLRLSRRLRVVAEGADGAEAVVLAAEHRPALMLLDVSMPGTDGLQALPKVLEASPATRVVMFSGFAEQGLAERTVAAGATAFLEKSSSMESLADDLLGLLGDRPAGAALPREDAPVDEPPASVLDEHLERFRELFEEATIGMATLTLTGHVVRVNRAFAALVRSSPEDLVGRSYGELTSGREEVVARLLDAVHAGGVDVMPFEHDVSGSSPRRRVLATLTPVRDSRGRPLYLFVQAQDVTEARAAEEQLRRSEERFRLMVEQVRDHAIFMLDPDGRIASWNTGAQRMKGYRAEEIIGQHFRVFYPRELQEARHPEHELEIALREGRYEEDGWRVRKDGTLFWANVVITAVRDDSGTLVGFAKVTRDQTRRREDEEALRQSEERFRLLVQAVRDYAIFLLDPHGHVVSWNAGAERIQGYAAREIVGRHFRVFYPPAKQRERHPEHELEIALREGRYEEEGWRVRKDGSRFWAHVTITAVFNQHGEHIGFTKVTRDTTERRQLMQQQEEAAAALARANTDLSAVNDRLRRTAEDQAQFLAVTAHELRNPVGVLSGSADLLATHWADLTDTERDETLAGMASSASLLRRLLADLLTASRLQASALDLHPVPVEVAGVLASAVAGVRRTHPEAEVEVTAEPGVTVLADPDRLGQAVDNLVVNAVRHGASPVRVHLDANRTTARIRVTDSGEGVEPAMQARLFERFATGAGRGGTGLGLFIVRELARAQGGDASYEPGTPDAPAGSFVLTLPRVD